MTVPRRPARDRRPVVRGVVWKHREEFEPGRIGHVAAARTARRRRRALEALPHHDGDPHRCASSSWSSSRRTAGTRGCSAPPRSSSPTSPSSLANVEPERAADGSPRTPSARCPPRRTCDADPHRRPDASASRRPTPIEPAATHAGRARHERRRTTSRRARGPDAAPRPAGGSTGAIPRIHCRRPRQVLGRVRRASRLPARLPRRPRVPRLGAPARRRRARRPR